MCKLQIARTESSVSLARAHAVIPGLSYHHRKPVEGQSVHTVCDDVVSGGGSSSKDCGTMDPLLYPHILRTPQVDQSTIIEQTICTWLLQHLKTT